MKNLNVTLKKQMLPSLILATYEVADRRSCICDNSVQNLLQNLTSDQFVDLKGKRKTPVRIEILINFN